MPGGSNQTRITGVGERPWTTSDVGNSLFTEGLPVRLIATPRSKFHVCRPNDPLKAVVANNVEQFDFFPVVDGDHPAQRIVGLVDLRRYHEDPPAPDLCVHNQMRQLTEETLIGAGAVAGLVGIVGGVVSGVFNLESPGIAVPGWRPRHDERYHSSDDSAA